MIVSETAVNPPRPQPADRVRSLVRELSPNEALVSVYLVGLNLAVLAGDRSVGYARNVTHVVSLLLCFCVGVVLTRGGLLPDGLLKGLVYRVAIYGPVQISYFFFRELLPAINPRAFDHELHSIDQALFGIEPAVAMDRIVNSFTTEWFSFFYFGYFFVLAVHVVPILFAVKNQRELSEFALGMLVLFCVGHTVYMLVPGYGPYHAMPEAFQTPFPRGLWLDLVMEAVRSGGALKDIFPSLHTAAPTFILLFSFRNRARVPFRYTWPLVAFFCINIIVATMFLRWHYLIDVVAGLLLAAGTIAIVPRIVDRELRRRALLSLSPLWPPMWRGPAN
jgi:membrane-associated phospholipid phosphatase